MQKLAVSRFKGLGFCAEDDLYDLAQLLLKIHLADDLRTGAGGRTTVSGLARAYAALRWSCTSEDVLQYILSQGIPYAATIEPDDLP